ncbi:MAG: hypothetical protein LBL75_01840 [Rickettsiales bacterium]|jgi:hypothetical protein|nr:hypothetical protein [Rickettsiales bacterium]
MTGLKYNVGRKIIKKANKVILPIFLAWLLSNSTLWFMLLDEASHIKKSSHPDSMYYWMADKALKKTRTFKGFLTAWPTVAGWNERLDADVLYQEVLDEYGWFFRNTSGKEREFEK